MVVGSEVMASFNKNKELELRFISKSLSWKTKFLAGIELSLIFKLKIVSIRLKFLFKKYELME